MKKNFFVLMYDRTCPYKFMKECRKYLFTKMNHTVETSPYKKKKNSLQHIRKAMLQCDISSSCLTLHATVVDLKWNSHLPNKICFICFLGNL